MQVLDNYFGINAQSVVARSKRAGILASNIVHADTPNYKAKDIDFKSLFDKNNVSVAMQPASSYVSHKKHIPLTTSSEFSLHTKYRNPEHSSLDGNTVDAHVEKSSFMDNAVRYQISLSMLDSKIQGLIRTLKGE